MTWISSRHRKRYQRAINKYVRMMNENIRNDHLWRGRFYIHQVAAEFERYRDGSGAELHVLLEFVDRVTGKTYQCWDSVNSWIFLGGWKIFEKMNWFICDYIEVWQENPNPREATYDFRKCVR